MMNKAHEYSDTQTKYALTTPGQRKPANWPDLMYDTVNTGPWEKSNFWACFMKSSSNVHNAM
jgi:hypothetical protein